MPPTAVRDHDRLTRCRCGHFKTEHRAEPRTFPGSLWCTAQLAAFHDGSEYAEPVSCACLEFWVASPAEELVARTGLAALR